MIKKCGRCKKEFIITEQEKSYCSNNCRKLKTEYQITFRNLYRIKRLLLQKRYRENNKEKLRQKGEIYRQNHKQETSNYDKQYYQKNKEKRLEQHKIYINNKLKTDIHFKIIHCLRHRIYEALKGIGRYKHTIELIGCSIENLKSHLESKFTEGMTWENYGKWHVDHIRPCASFDLSLPEEQCKCFNYTNLQPLWAEDNLSKGAKY